MPFGFAMFVRRVTFLNCRRYFSCACCSYLEILSFRKEHLHFYTHSPKSKSRSEVVECKRSLDQIDCTDQLIPFNFNNIFQTTNGCFSHAFVVSGKVFKIDDFCHNVLCVC